MHRDCPSESHKANISLSLGSADESAFERAIVKALGDPRTAGRIDGLILNAGTLDPMGKIVSDTTIDSWKKHFDVNFFSLVSASKYIVPILKNNVTKGDSADGTQGRVVFVSSGAAVKGTPGWG